MPRADRLLDLFFVRGQIQAVSTAAARTRAIRIGGVPGLSWTPGQQVRVHVNDLLSARTLRRPGDVLRTYSVWDYDGERLDLRVLDHGDGPGARWAREAAPGDPVVFGRPEGRLVLRDAPFHLFAGEETAAAAFGPMLRALPARAAAHAVVETASAASRLPLEGEVTWLERGETSAFDSPTLLKAVAGLDLPASGTAYLAGEARTCQSIKRHLVAERGWDRRSVVVKPFWTPGKRGMD